MNNDKLKFLAVNETAFGSESWGDAPAPTRSPNEGGITPGEYAEASQSSAHPRLVIRGESLNNTTNNTDGERHEMFTKNGRPYIVATPIPKADGHAYSAITDFLNCTFSFKDHELDNVLFDLIDCLGQQFSPIKDRLKGLHGWEQSIQLGETKTFFAYGGQNNTAFLSIPGEACHMVPSWLKLTILIRDKYKGKITRWDGAVDDYEGKHTVDSAVDAYLKGEFNAGGKQPSCDQKGNWLIPDGRGRTFYVGKRENGKIIRIYEKGMQLGQLWHPWVRWEIELHSVDRIIPWEVLLEPGKFVAGSYPKVTGWIQDEMQRVKTIKKSAQISYDYMVNCASISFGKLINVMREVEGSDAKVLEKLERNGIPSRLDLPIVDKNEGWDK